MTWSKGLDVVGPPHRKTSIFGFSCSAKPRHKKTKVRALRGHYTNVIYNYLLKEQGKSFQTMQYKIHACMKKYKRVMAVIEI